MEVEAWAVSKLFMTTIMVTLAVKVNGVTEGVLVLLDIMGPLNQILDCKILWANKITLLFEPVEVSFSVPHCFDEPNWYKTLELWSWLWTCLLWTYVMTWCLYWVCAANVMKTNIVLELLKLITVWEHCIFEVFFLQFLFNIYQWVAINGKLWFFSPLSLFSDIQLLSILLMNSLDFKPLHVLLLLLTYAALPPTLCPAKR